MIRKIFFCLFLILVVSCGSDRVKKDVVVERMEGFSKRPKWIDESKVFTEKKSDTYIIGQAKAPANNVNMAMLYRIAESNAKVSLASSIEQRLNYIFQNAEEGLDVYSNQIKYVSTESADLTISSLKPNDRYWEKVLSTVDAYGTQELNYLVYVRMKISDVDLKKAIDRVINKKDRKISESFKKQVDAQWEKVANEQ